MQNKFLMWGSLFLIVLGMVGAAYAAPTAPGYVTGASIADSYHNLSVTGPGNLKAAANGTQEICVFCHTPHNASNSRLIWNKGDWSSWPNQSADFGTPDGNTNMGTAVSNVTLTAPTLRCLSCHDGSTSVGQVNFVYNASGAQSNVALPMTGSDQTSGKITNSLFVVGNGTTVGGKRDMSKNHPVSIPYAGSTYNSIVSGGGGIVDNFVAAPAVVTASADILKGSAAAYGVECTSCHDVHGQGDSTKSSTLPSHLGQMVRVGMDNSNLCLTCHIK